MISENWFVFVVEGHEKIDFAKFSDAVVVQRPRGMEVDAFNAFIRSLVSKSILPIISVVSQDEDELSPFPGDMVFSIGNMIFSSDPAEMTELLDLLSQNQALRPRLPHEPQAVGHSFGGPELVFKPNLRIIFYDVAAEQQVILEEQEYQNTHFSQSASKELELLNALKTTLQNQGWTLTPLSLDIRSQPREHQLFDTLMGVLPAKEGGLCILLPETVVNQITSLVDLVPDEHKEAATELLSKINITIISVPEAEVLKGACNMAKIGSSGRLILAPSMSTCPLTYAQLMNTVDFSKVELIPVPDGFSQGGGGAKSFFGSIPLRSVH